MTDRYVDIHSHILPCVDDGAQSMEESIAMLNMAYEEGIRTIIATPHYGMKEYNIDLADCAKKVEELNAQIRIHGSPVDMNIILGNELLYHTGISDELISGRAKPLGNTDFVLVEFYENADITILEACAREMKMAGYRPIIAHAERYIALRDFDDKISLNVERVEALKNEGALVQVNAGECLGEIVVPYVAKPKGVRRLLGGGMRSSGMDEFDVRRAVAWDLIKSGMADFIASDAHRQNVRVPVMDKAIKRIRDVAGADIAHKLIINSQLLG